MPSGAPLRIDDVAQTVAEQVEAENRDHQRETREERDPPFAGEHEGRALGDHDAPLRLRGPHAQADEGEARGVEDRPAHVERNLHHHRRHGLRPVPALRHRIQLLPGHPHLDRRGGLQPVEGPRPAELG